MANAEILEGVHTVATVGFVLAAQAGGDVYADAVTAGVMQMVAQATERGAFALLLREAGALAAEIAAARESARVYLGKRGLGDPRKVSAADLTLAEAVAV